MKKIILAISLLSSTHAFCQDSVNITNVSLQARLWEYLTPNLFNAENDSAFAVFLKVRTAFRATLPTGTTLVSIDTVKIQTLSDMYNYTLANSDGMGASALLKSQLASKRSANTWLDNLMTAAETYWANRLIQLRTNGRRLLLGK